MTEQVATKIAVEGIFYTSVAFVVAVSTFWGWWRGQLGWSIIAKTMALAVAVFPAMLMYWLGYRVPHWAEWVSIFALWAIPPILVWRAVVLWRLQRQGGQPL